MSCIGGCTNPDMSEKNFKILWISDTRLSHISDVFRFSRHKCGPIFLATGRIVQIRDLKSPYYVEHEESSLYVIRNPSAHLT
jgi:hypothetical protein